MSELVNDLEVMTEEEVMKIEMIEIMKEIARGEHENEEMKVCADFLADNDIEIMD